MRFDVTVIGGTPAGVAAAIAAAREGASVLLTEESLHLGGLMSSGLGATDIGVRETVGGLFRELTRRVRAHYAACYGEDSEQVALCADGYHFEPSVAEVIFDQLIAESGVTVRRGLRLAWEGGPTLTEGGRWVVETACGATAANPDGVAERRVTAVTLEVLDARGEPTGRRLRVEAAAFIDATYTGDVALGAGAPYRVGRESWALFGESHAGVVYQDFITRRCYDAATDLVGAADRRVQAYNYRLCLTRSAQRRPFTRPASYDRCHYLSLVEEIRSGRTPVVMAPRDTLGLLDVIRLPNGKTDCNNSPFSLCSTDWPEENAAYPEAGPALRKEIERSYREYVEGLLWFAQHDPEVPVGFRREAAQWGLAPDEFTDTENFPRQLYVRGAARIVGEHVFTMADALPGTDGGRAPLQWDSVACGAFQIDSHATRKREDQDAVLTPEDGRSVALEGLFVVPSVPYGVPYRCLLPVGVDGLLVPVALSASHAGFGTLRMEPTWMALGEAAGTAAALAVRDGVRLRDVPRATLQRRLLERGQVIAHVADVTPPDFCAGGDARQAELSAAVQFWAARGFFPEYEARPGETLTEREARRWVWLFRRSVDPWSADAHRPPALGGCDGGKAPVTQSRLAELLCQEMAEPSPLRVSLGVPELPCLEADEEITRGEACRLLYALHAACPGGA